MAAWKPLMNFLHETEKNAFMTCGLKIRGKKGQEKSELVL